MNTTNPSSSPAATLDLGIGGMTCASCVTRVEKALKKVPGVTEATVNLATESARIRFAPGDQVEARLRRAVRDAGYEPRAADALAQEADESPWAGFAPVAVGLALSLPLVLPMLADLVGVHWMLPPWLHQHRCRAACRAVDPARGKRADVWKTRGHERSGVCSRCARV